MSFDFTKKRSPAGASRTSAPDYTTRGARFRLFILLATLMGVATLVSKVADPDFWAFMGWKPQGIAGGPPLTKAEVADRRVDTELRPRSESGPADAVPTLQVPRQDSQSAAAAEFTDPLALAWFDGWTTYVDKLSSQEKSLLFKGLKWSRDQKTLDKDDQIGFALLVERADQAWSEYRERARQSLDSLPADDREKWSDLVKRLAENWGRKVKPALDRVATGQTFVAEDRPPLDELQTYLDKIALAAVEDDTLQRSGETTAWFRLLEKLQQSEPAELRKASSGIVGYLQLFDQPNRYRGRLVTIRGTIRRGYHVAASKNPYGVERYYVFWLFPAGGPDSPIVIYSLEKPPGFPPIRAQNQPDEATALHEDAEFTGYFFKRWAYASQSGIRMAPLLLARTPKWEPSAADLRKPPSGATLAAAVALCAVAAFAAAYYGYKKSLALGRR